MVTILSSAAGRPARRLPGLSSNSSGRPEIEADFAASEIKTFRIPQDENLPVIETNLLESEN